MRIYKITNILNNKVYIGQTIKKNLNQRLSFHFGNYKPKYASLIHRAIKKYGKENFKVDIIYTAQNLDDLNEKECFFIKELNTLSPNGYNLQAGGQKNKHTELTKTRISLAKKGKPNNGKAAKDIKKSFEHCRSLSIARKGFTSENRRRAAIENGIKKNKKVKITCIKTNITMVFNSIKSAASVLNICANNISRVCNKKQGRTQVSGYKCEYI